jgi:hypothetical protein
MQQNVKAVAPANLIGYYQSFKRSVFCSTPYLVFVARLIYALPGRRLYFFKRGAGVPPLAGGYAPTPPLSQNLWAWRSF